MNIKAIIKKNQGVVFCYLIALVLFAGFSVYMLIPKMAAWLS